MELFNKKINNKAKKKKIAVEHLTCECGREILNQLVYANHSTCIYCGYLFKVPAYKRIEMLVDEDSFIEILKDAKSTDPLIFPEYSKKLAKAKKASGLNEAIVVGTCEIGGMPLGLGVMDPYFMMGSMGEIVGEKICQLADACLAKKMPMVIFCASGGARMQEGMISLLQMSRTTIAVNKLNDAGLLYISVLTNPTTGGVTASFAMQGDVIFAEPKAMIAFAGPRVIEQTVNDILPVDFQTTEYLLKKGMIDAVIDRRDLRDKLKLVLSLHR
jgi:acetyl-CoA carboxylase carboxyl transferase beta subunit